MVADPFVRASRAVPNLRDLGERRTPDGLIPAGRFFRSGEPTGVGAGDDLRRLGIAWVVDLRTAGEAAQRPDRVPDGVVYQHLDVLADIPAEVAQGQVQLMSDPVAFTAAFGHFDPVEQMHRTYADLVTAPAALAGYADLLQAVLAADGAPLLVHCTVGKDRTGWAVTVLLLAAGVPHEVVRAEYMAVNPAVRDAFAGLVDQYLAAGAPRELLVPMLEVREEYLDTALACVEDVFGGFDGYLREGLGLAGSQVAALRALLVR
ncbi:MAG: tyrosine-protein phosphatase [Micrococcales bacterium]|nr:tyrosine-protein phosphatase [Micrococcales bacterium]